MTVISTPLWLQGGTYAADDDRSLLRALVSAAGCVEATGMAVLQNGTPNMTVNVSAGRVFVQRTSATDFYLTENDAVANLTISAADPTNPRRDLIVARVYDAAFSGALNQATVEVVTGTPAGSPVDPTVPANSFVLARVAVAAAAASIVTANITDLRTYWKVNRPADSIIVYSATGALTTAQINGARAVRVRVWGATGGGGGAAAASAGNSTAGSGGGGPGYAESIIDASTLAASTAITVATGGAAGSTAGGAGGAGSGATSFGALVSVGAAAGGQGGATSAATAAVLGLGGAGGTPTAGNIQIQGAAGGAAYRISAAVAWGGAGGGTAFLQGAAGDGLVGSPCLSGGGGGAALNTATPHLGGAGADGRVIVELIY